jgi:predicted metal-dependent peptidase
MTDVREAISKVVDRWFLYEPLFFNVYCTHKLEENSEMKCAFRTGKRRIEYNPELLKGSDIKEIEMGLRTEVTRILLKHPYQRVPPYPNRAALTTASDVTIREHCFYNEKLHDANHYDFVGKLSYEEYYKKLSLICPNIDNSGTDSNATSRGFSFLKPYLKDGETWEYEAAADASEFWAEDDEMADKVNQQIEKAQKTNQWGSVSGDFQETVTASLRIPMDYRRMLAQFRASIISQRRKLTRMKPNRRYGFEFMGSQFEPKTHLLVAVDVSGSIETEDLKNFFSIINRFFSYGVEAINVITFDWELQQEFELKKAAKNIKITGRGGTNFQCAVDYYENHPEFQGMIIFTDGYAEVPKIKKAKQLLWILTGKMEYDHAIKWIKELRLSKATWIPSVKKGA